MYRAKHAVRHQRQGQRLMGVSEDRSRRSYLVLLGDIGGNEIMSLTAGYGPFKPHPLEGCRYVTAPRSRQPEKMQALVLRHALRPRAHCYRQAGAGPGTRRGHGTRAGDAGSPIRGSPITRRVGGMQDAGSREDGTLRPCPTGRVTFPGNFTLGVLWAPAVRRRGIPYLSRRWRRGRGSPGDPVQQAPPARRSRSALSWTLRVVLRVQPCLARSAILEAPAMLRARPIRAPRRPAAGTGELESRGRDARSSPCRPRSRS